MEEENRPHNCRRASGTCVSSRTWSDTGRPNPSSGGNKVSACVTSHLGDGELTDKAGDRHPRPGLLQGGNDLLCRTARLPRRERPPQGNPPETRPRGQDHFHPVTSRACHGPPGLQFCNARDPVRDDQDSCPLQMRSIRAQLVHRRVTHRDGDGFFFGIEGLARFAPFTSDA